MKRMTQHSVATVTQPLVSVGDMTATIMTMDVLDVVTSGVMGDAMMSLVVLIVDLDAMALVVH